MLDKHKTHIKLMKFSNILFIFSPFRRHINRDIFDSTEVLWRSSSKKSLRRKSNKKPFLLFWNQASEFVNNSIKTIKLIQTDNIAVKRKAQHFDHKLKSKTFYPPLFHSIFQWSALNFLSHSNVELYETQSNI